MSIRLQRWARRFTDSIGFRLFSRLAMSLSIVVAIWMANTVSNLADMADQVPVLTERLFDLDADVLRTRDNIRRIREEITTVREDVARIRGLLEAEERLKPQSVNLLK